MEIERGAKAIEQWRAVTSRADVLLFRVISTSCEEDMGQETLTSIADRIERIPHALTARELMTILQVSDQTIYRMIADQTISSVGMKESHSDGPRPSMESTSKRRRLTRWRMTKKK